MRGLFGLVDILPVVGGEDIDGLVSALPPKWIEGCVIRRLQAMVVRPQNAAERRVREPAESLRLRLATVEERVPQPIPAVAFQKHALSAVEDLRDIETRR